MRLANSSLPTLAAAALLLGLPACGGEEDRPFPPNSGPITDKPEGGGFSSTLDDIQANVFTPSCAVSGACHAAPKEGEMPGAGLILGGTGTIACDAELAFRSLVGDAGSGIRATEAELFRVTPGDPNGSYLIQKLEGKADTPRMPLGRAALPTLSIAVIRSWIADGAPPAATPCVP